MNVLPRDEDGLTLTELIIYVLVSALFAGLLAALFINGMQANAQTTDRDSATGRASVVSTSLFGSIRNALSFTVKDGGSSVVAVVATGSTGWECRAWSLVGDELRYRAQAGAIDTATAPVWGALSDGVTPTLPGAVAFESTGARGLAVGLDIAGEDEIVSLEDGVTAQAVTDEAGTPTCW
ncbi:hypothetical protein ACQ143_00355 [Microbacterium sp. MC2]